MVEIIVCVKHVVEETELKIDRQGQRLIFDGVPTKLSDQDRNAVEEAVRIKEKVGGRVTTITLGPPEAKQTIRSALAMGADRAVILSDPLFADSDAYVTAQILAVAIKKLGSFDLVLTGDVTTDYYTGQVGPSLAELLGIPHVAYATKMTITDSDVSVSRLVDEGVETVKAHLPVLVTITREINQPRLPTLLQIMGASKKPILEWKSQDLGLDGSSVGRSASLFVLVGLEVPTASRKNMRIKGTNGEIAAELLRALLKEGVLR